MRFTPSNSGQRSAPTYYRGCWHVVSRAFFLGYRQPSLRPASSPRKGVYAPKGVIPHAALLRQGCPHCGRFLAAASRRSRGRVSVPVWLAVLSDQLPITALVGRHPANQLIGRRRLLERPEGLSWRRLPRRQRMRNYPPFPAATPHSRAACPRVPHPSATQARRSAPRPTCMH